MSLNNDVKNRFAYQPFPDRRDKTTGSVACLKLTSGRVLVEKSFLKAHTSGGGRRVTAQEGYNAEKAVYLRQLSYVPSLYTFDDENHVLYIDYVGKKLKSDVKSVLKVHQLFEKFHIDTGMHHGDANWKNVRTVSSDDDSQEEKLMLIDFEFAHSSSEPCQGWNGADAACECYGGSGKMLNRPPEDCIRVETLMFRDGFYHVNSEENRCTEEDLLGVDELEGHFSGALLSDMRRSSVLLCWINTRMLMLLS